jgi:hypothetical protein
MHNKETQFGYKSNILPFNHESMRHSTIAMRLNQPTKRETKETIISITYIHRHSSSIHHLTFSYN